ncbi:E3 ubiquitin-protein ligase RLIM-like [Mus pahari]|uniref:E3 ubiquitin-protein ligase RLIM-like n=1 Tax=Mus pahari TaxID=10093 RepID=UPI000A30FBA2|nr:E3 ubiquitin-protein ligase RLIM-like [Mus pahari]
MIRSHPFLNVDGMTCLKVENLAHHTSSYTLKHVFKDYGPLGDVYIPRNHLTEEHYGFAFIHFYNKCDAKDAVHSLNGFLLDGCKLKIQMVSNDDPHYVQPDCDQGRKYHYKEENHDLQSKCERQHFSITRIQARSHSRSPDHKEPKSQFCNRSHRRLSSTRSKTQSSVSTQQLPNRACPKSRDLPGEKMKLKPKSSDKSASKYPSGGGLLVGKKVENNQRQVENIQSNSMFEKLCRSKVNATHTLIAHPSTRSQTRKRFRSPQNSRESPRLERIYAENKKRPMEHPQSESIIKKTYLSKEIEPEILTEYDRSQRRTRRRSQRLPRSNNSKRCGANTADVLHGVDSESRELNSLQQSEKRTKMGIDECGFQTAKCQSNPNNNDITGGMRVTFNKGNTIQQNDLSALSCHDSNRRIQKQLDYQELESIHVTPFTQEGNITEVLMEDTCNKDISTRRNSADVLILKETIESRLHQDTKDMALVELHYCLSPETFDYLRKDEAYIFSNSHTFLPLRDDLAISELQKLYFFPSFPTREHILTGSTAHRSQSISVTQTNFTSEEIDQKEHTKISSCSNQTGIKISEIISDDETSNTNVDFTIPTAPCGKSRNIMLGVFEVGDNFTEFDLQSCDSLSSQNNRTVHSGHSRISRSVSSSNSNSTTNTSTRHSLLSLLNYSQQFLPVPGTSDNIIGNDINLPHTSQINQECDELISFHWPPFEATQQMHVTSPETSNDSDSWPVLPDFSNFNDIHNNHPKGLTKEQINSLPVYIFCENDKISYCSICLTPYIQKSKIRVLPCFHEYHDECIDRWLSDNSTCPICRQYIINPDDTEILF